MSCRADGGPVPHAAHKAWQLVCQVAAVFAALPRGRMRCCPVQHHFETWVSRMDLEALYAESFVLKTMALTVLHTVISYNMLHQNHSRSAN